MTDALEQARLLGQRLSGVGVRVVEPGTQVPVGRGVGHFSEVTETEAVLDGDTLHCTQAQFDLIKAATKAARSL